MTLAVRNALFALGITVGSLLVALFALGVWQFWFGSFDLASVTVPQSETWLVFTWRIPRAAAIAALGATGVASSIALAGSVVSARLFKRVSSQEIYFITLFLITLTVEVVRLGQFLVELYSLPLFYGVVTTRVLLISRLLGGLSLFAAGVYNAGAEYPRAGTVSLLLFVLALLIVYLVPVDPQRLQASLVHRTGADGGIDAILLFLSAGAVVNYAIGWAKGYHERGGALFLAVALLAAAQVLLLNVPTIVVSVIGALFLLSGTTMFVVVNRNYHLWY